MSWSTRRVVLDPGLVALTLRARARGGKRFPFLHGTIRRQEVRRARRRQRTQLLARARQLAPLLGPRWLLDMLALVAALGGAVLLLAAIAGEPFVAWWR